MTIPLPGISPIPPSSAPVSPRGSAGARHIFFVRAGRAIQRLQKLMSTAELEVAVTEPTDFGVVLAALESEAGMMRLAQDDPLAEARLRGTRMKQRLLAREGGVLGAGEVAKLLGISRQAVNKRAKAGKLLAIQTGRHGYSYPAWQFVEGGVLAGLGEVLASLDEAFGPWTLLAFFLNPNITLDDRSPLDVLRTGDLANTLRVARTHGQHIAT